MGTTLTGTTPQDTYDSLIKVTDNGPLSGSLKTLTDGLGNDSALALSTGAASITGTLGVTGTMTLGISGVANAVLNSADGMYLNIDSDASGSTPEFMFAKGRSGASGGTALMTITNAGNVGIGTSSPSALIHGSKAAGNAPELRLSSATVYAKLIADDAVGGTAILDGAYAIKLLVDGSERARVTTNGLTFNGDTAAANALDDYEEGTWTPVITDITNDATMISGTLGYYTKIGRQVTLSAYCRTTSIGSVTGDIYIKGMPFTSSGNLGSETSVTFGYFTGMSLGSAGVSVGGYIVRSTTRMALYINDVSTGITAMQASEWGNTGYVHLGITYFV